MKRLRLNKHGFGLIELVVIIVVIGILAAAATKWMQFSVSDLRQIKTRREMETLAKAIVGDPSRMQNGARCDFGYVGDVGAFPDSISWLYNYPIAYYFVWKGPYIPKTFAVGAAASQQEQDSRTDEWGVAYAYSGGLTITSSGSGHDITKKIANATTDYTSDTLRGRIRDCRDSLPGSIMKDSITICMYVPDGTGDSVLRSTTPSSTGVFALAPLVVGRHTLNVIYTPAHDTLARYVTILPRHKSDSTDYYAFSSNYFSYSRRCALVIQKAITTSTLSYFPLLLTEVTLPSEMFDADGSYPAGNGGGDIIFTSDSLGATRLPCEIVTFTTDNNPANGKAEIWVKVTSISSSANTTIYVWYNRPYGSQPAVDSTYGAESVWDTNYVMIQHMNEVPPATATDATKYDNDGTAGSSMTSADTITGKIGLATDFDAASTGDLYTVPAAGTVIRGSAITMEAWVYIKDTTGSLYGQAAMAHYTDYILMYKTAANRPANFIYNTTYYYSSSKNISWFLGGWHQIICTYDGANVKNYIDGSQDSTSFAKTDTLNTSVTTNLGLGSTNRGAISMLLNGRLDEVHLSKTARAAAWVGACYKNQSDPNTYIVEGTPVSPY